jgi:hypothetical protein
MNHASLSVLEVLLTQGTLPSSIWQLLRFHAKKNVFDRVNEFFLHVHLHFGIVLHSTGAVKEDEENAKSEKHVKRVTHKAVLLCSTTCY